MAALPFVVLLLLGLLAGAARAQTHSASHSISPVPPCLTNFTASVDPVVQTSDLRAVGAGDPSFGCTYGVAEIPYIATKSITFQRFGVDLDVDVLASSGGQITQIAIMGQIIDMAPLGYMLSGTFQIGTSFSSLYVGVDVAIYVRTPATCGYTSWQDDKFILNTPSAITACGSKCPLRGGTSKCLYYSSPYNISLANVTAQFQSVPTLPLKFSIRVVGWSGASTAPAALTLLTVNNQFGSVSLPIAQTTQYGRGCHSTPDTDPFDSTSCSASQTQTESDTPSVSQSPSRYSQSQSRSDSHHSQSQSHSCFYLKMCHNRSLQLLQRRQCGELFRLRRLHRRAARPRRGHGG